MFQKGLICGFFCALLTLVAFDAARAESGGRCAGAEVSAVNASQFHPGGEACFATYLPSAGLLTLEVGVPSVAAVEPRLDFLGSSCDRSQAAQPDFRYRQRLANAAWIEIRRAGDYFFCVEAQDPALEIGEYRLANGFLAAALYKTDPDEDEPEPDPFGCSHGGFFKTDPDEDEPEPDPFGCSLGGFFKTDEDEDEPEPDPFGCSYGGFFKTDPDEDEPEPDPFACTPALGLLCRQNRTDDHGDTMGCATPVRLGHEIEAEIRGDLGQDRDLFTFRVDELTTVRVETRGDFDARGSLHDRRGYRLDFDDDGGREVGFRMVKTLVPGRYFIRVEGTGSAQGAYRMMVEDLGSEE